MTMRVRMLLATVTAAALSLAACSQTVAGEGQGSATAPESTPLPRTLPVSSPPALSSPIVPSSPVVASSAPISTPEPHSSSPGAAGCAPGIDYCDDFSDRKSGWETNNESDYYTNYAGYLGGTYRMGTRAAVTLYEEAPVSVTRFASDYRIRVDADIDLATRAPTDSLVGLDCWSHRTSSGHQAGFAFYVQSGHAEIYLLSDSGSKVRLKRVSLPSGYPIPGKAFHLAVACLQTATGAADVAMAIDGSTVAEAMYAKGTRTKAWSVAAKVGLVVGQKNADAFFDNVTVKHVT